MATSERQREANRRWREKNPGYRRNVAVEKAWYARNSAQVAARSKARKAKINGWDIAKVPELLHIQHGCCAICGVLLVNSGKGNDSAALDHCHATSKARGILCFLCNKGLGGFRDSEFAMQNAIKYLREHGQESI